MDKGTMQDYLDDLMLKANEAAQAMEQASAEIERLRADNKYWSDLFVYESKMREAAEDCLQELRTQVEYWKDIANG